MKLNFVHDNSGNLLGTVNRSYELVEEDASIIVELNCGFKAEFWLIGLTDEEYIKRTQLIKKQEQNA